MTESSLPEILNGMTYFLDVIMQNMFLPGQIENWVIVSDLNNLGITSLPMNVLIKFCFFYFFNEN